MKISHEMGAVLKRWPEEGLDHSTGLVPGKQFDPKRSNVCRFLIEQAEIWAFMFHLMKDRGLIEYRGGKWHAVDPAGVIRPRGSRNAGAAGVVAVVCPPELALWVLSHQDDGAAKWLTWKAACEAEVEAPKKWGKWAFYHSCVKPLSTAGDVTKNATGEWVALREVEDRPAVAKAEAAGGSIEDRLYEQIHEGAANARPLPVICKAARIDMEDEEQAQGVAVARRALQAAGRVALSLGDPTGWYRPIPARGVTAAEEVEV